ncbi:MAG TPA: MerR family transcriptional regulator [Gaiellaceae bacterium]
MHEDLIPIGRFAQAARLSQKALRLYDENGLLPPQRIDEDSGYRFYSWRQLRLARRIALLREAGMPLAEIRRLLDDPRPELIDAYRARLEAELDERERVLDFVRATIEEGPMYEVKVRRAGEERYASWTDRVPQEQVEEFVIASLRELASEHEPAGHPFTLYHGLAPGNEGEEAEIGPVEVCLPARDGDRTLPEGEVAYAIARGDQCRYPQIVGAYDAVWEWAREHGRDLAGPPREIYRFEAGEERVFEIAWPLEGLASRPSPSGS